MALAMRVLRSMLTAAVIAAALGSGVSPAEAAGYWSCADGQWTAIGSPRHPKPVKTCGSEFAVPETEGECRAAGGRWGPVGIFPAPICRVPTRDGGRICGDDSECEGHCLATLTPAERREAMAGKRFIRSGQCTPHRPVFGCMAVVEKGVVNGVICRD
jgi:hypothetical protein